MLRAGFRCGICYEYPFFDVCKREKLNLKIRPLIVMEAALIRSISPVDMEECMKRLAEIVHYYNGDYVFYGIMIIFFVQKFVRIHLFMRIS